MTSDGRNDTGDKNGAGLDGAGYGNPGGVTDTGTVNKTSVGAGSTGDSNPGRPDIGDAVAGDGQLSKGGPFGNSMSSEGVTEFGEGVTDAEGAQDEQ